MPQLPSIKMKRRANLAILALTFGFASLVTANLFKIMVVDAKKYQKIADENQFGVQAIPASRGSIFSADGNILAQSATAYQIMLDPGAFRANEHDNSSIILFYVLDKLGIDPSVEENKEAVKVIREAVRKEKLQAYLDTVTERPEVSEIRNKTAGKSSERLIKELFSEHLAEVIGIDVRTVSDALDEDSRCVYLINKAEKPIKDKVEKYVSACGLSCMKITANSKRYYPQDDLASSVVGFLNYDGVGQYGIELQYDEYLSGVDGSIVTAQDAFDEQMPYRYSKLYEAKDGDSVNLTIDSMIQYYCETALDAAIEGADAVEYGCAVVMNAKTGAVLGMYSAPGFDINNKGVLSADDQALLEAQVFVKDEKERITEADLLEKMWKNKAISVINEPGSVFKVVTGSAALEEKTASFESTYTCIGKLNVDGEDIACHATYGHGKPVLDFKEALLNSCNPSFMQIGLDLGAEKFSYYADAFGLREKTGIDLPGEVKGDFASYDGMLGLANNNVTLASSAFGQTNCITPLQMVTAYTAAINGGYLLRPYVVGSIVDSDMNEVSVTEKEVRRQVISEETSALMREALQNNVDSKNKGNAAISGYKIGGKSGTAEKLSKLSVENNRYNTKIQSDPALAETLVKPKKEYVASYCAFAPADDPEIVVYAALDEPYTGTESYYGGTIAAPCVRSILENVLPYLGYYPEYTDEEKLTMDKRVPDVEKLTIDEAIEKVKEAGFTPELRGDGDNVVTQIPSFTSSMPAGGKVFLYTDPFASTEYFAMPDLKGMKFSAAQELLESYGLNIKITGSQSEDAIVLSQSVDATTMVNEGQIVSVHFGINSQTG